MNRINEIVLQSRLRYLRIYCAIDMFGWHRVSAVYVTKFPITSSSSFWKMSVNRFSIILFVCRYSYVNNTKCNPSKTLIKETFSHNLKLFKDEVKTEYQHLHLVYYKINKHWKKQHALSLHYLIWHLYCVTLKKNQ